MKFFCDYCGARIDAEVEDKCPNCGASYKKNKTFLRMEEEKLKREKSVNDFQETVLNSVKTNIERARKFSIVPIILFVVIFVFAIGMFLPIGKKAINNRNNSNNLEGELYQNNESDEKEITAKLGETVKTSKYTFTVTGYKVKNDTIKKPDSGYEYVEFYFNVENLYKERIWPKDVYCIVDGISQTNYYPSGYSTLPVTIAKGLTEKGSAIFMVPKDAKSYSIRYGDNITINIEK